MIRLLSDLRHSAILLLALNASTSAAEPTGEQIYRKRCASCHGETGEGGKKFKKSLVGDKSVAQLTQVIAKTMPEDDPGTCTGPEAEKVAAYVYDAFYSVAARERNKPPRVELARLTVKQYRNAVADLIGTFRPAMKADNRAGLRGEYFAARGFQGNRRVIDRIDPQIHFDFGTGTPLAGAFEPHEYSIRWEGSVLAPETGEYEFIVRTEHALRLYVNDNRTALIDAWVKSGSDIEYRASLFLIAGRSYPIRFEWTKSQQGVNEPKRAKEFASRRASIDLMWKLPGRPAETIASRYLSPGRSSVSYVPATAFPPDDRSLGWERGTTISKAWDLATTDAAIETAGYVAANIDELAAARGAADRPNKLRDFAKRFVERAFRRPLTEEERRLYVDHQFEIAKEPDAAIKRVVMLTLKSPRFLYRESAGDRDGYSIASRLSIALWDSLPDDDLLKSAATGKLTSRDEIQKQAERMLGDPRAKIKLREFLHTWLKVDQPRDVAKDQKRFPGFDGATISDLRSSLDLFLDEVVWSQASDFRRLLLDESVYMNGRLAKFYGATLTPDDILTRLAFSLRPGFYVRPPTDLPFVKTKLDAGERAGVLTHPYMLATFAYTGSTSPIHRGVFLARGVLGVGLRPPADAFTPLPEELHPSLTTRERVMLQTKPENCQSCHAVINPLGFTLERFDAVGRYRTQDNGKPIDASGAYETKRGDVVKISGARELGQFLANSEEVHTAFVQQMFHHLVQQPVRAYGPTTLNELRQTFSKSGCKIRKLAVEIATDTTMPIPGSNSRMKVEGR